MSGLFKKISLWSVSLVFIILISSVIDAQDICDSVCASEGSLSATCRYRACLDNEYVGHLGNPDCEIAIDSPRAVCCCEYPLNSCTKPDPDDVCPGRDNSSGPPAFDSPWYARINISKYGNLMYEMSEAYNAEHRGLTPPGWSHYANYNCFLKELQVWNNGSVYCYEWLGTYSPCNPEGYGHVEPEEAYSGKYTILWPVDRIYIDDTTGATTLPSNYGNTTVIGNVYTILAVNDYYYVELVKNISRAVDYCAKKPDDDYCKTIKADPAYYDYGIYVVIARKCDLLGTLNITHKCKNEPVYTIDNTTTYGENVDELKYSDCEWWFVDYGKYYDWPGVYLTVFNKSRVGADRGYVFYSIIGQKNMPIDRMYEQNVQEIREWNDLAAYRLMGCDECGQGNFTCSYGAALKQWNTYAELALGGAQDTCVGRVGGGTVCPQRECGYYDFNSTNYFGDPRDLVAKDYESGIPNRTITRNDSRIAPVRESITSIVTNISAYFITQTEGKAAVKANDKWKIYYYPCPPVNPTCNNGSKCEFNCEEQGYTSDPSGWCCRGGVDYWYESRWAILNYSDYPTEVNNPKDSDSDCNDPKIREETGGEWKEVPGRWDGNPFTPSNLNSECDYDPAPSCGWCCEGWGWDGRPCGAEGMGELGECPYRPGCKDWFPFLDAVGNQLVNDRGDPICGCTITGLPTRYNSSHGVDRYFRIYGDDYDKANCTRPRYQSDNPAIRDAYLRPTSVVHNPCENIGFSGSECFTYDPRYYRMFNLDLLWANIFKITPEFYDTTPYSCISGECNELAGNIPLTAQDCETLSNIVCGRCWSDKGTLDLYSGDIKTNCYNCKKLSGVSGANTVANCSQYPVKSACYDDMCDVGPCGWVDGKCIDARASSKNCTALGITEEIDCLAASQGIPGGCYWDVKWLNECLPCSKGTQSCSDYGKEDTCMNNPCGVLFNCWWEIKFFNECKSCSGIAEGNCSVYDNFKACHADTCYIGPCAWSEESGACINAPASPSEDTCKGVTGTSATKLECDGASRIVSTGCWFIPDGGILSLLDRGKCHPCWGIEEGTFGTLDVNVIKCEDYSDSKYQGFWTSDDAPKRACIEDMCNIGPCYWNSNSNNCTPVYLGSRVEYFRGADSADNSSILTRTGGNPGDDFGGGPIWFHIGAGGNIPNLTEAEGDESYWDIMRAVPMKPPPGIIWDERRNLGNWYTWDFPQEGLDCEWSRGYCEGPPTCMDGYDCNIDRDLDSCTESGVWSEIYNSSSTDPYCMGGKPPCCSIDDPNCSGDWPAPPADIDMSKLPASCGTLCRKEVAGWPRWKGQEPRTWVNLTVREESATGAVTETNYSAVPMTSNILPEPSAPYTFLQTFDIQHSLKDDTVNFTAVANYTALQEMRRGVYSERCAWHGCSRLRTNVIKWVCVSAGPEYGTLPDGSYGCVACCSSPPAGQVMGEIPCKGWQRTGDPCHITGDDPVGECYETFKDPISGGTCATFGWSECQDMCIGCWHQKGCYYEVSNKTDRILEDINDTSTVTTNAYGKDIIPATPMSEGDSEWINITIGGYIDYREQATPARVNGYLIFNVTPDLLNAIDLYIPDIIGVTFNIRNIPALHELTTLDSTPIKQEIIIGKSTEELLGMAPSCQDAGGYYYHWMYNPIHKYYNFLDQFMARSTNYSWDVTLKSENCAGGYFHWRALDPLATFRNYHEDEDKYWDFAAFTQVPLDLVSKEGYYAGGMPSVSETDVVQYRDLPMEWITPSIYYDVEKNKYIAGFYTATIDSKYFDSAQLVITTYLRGTSIPLTGNISWCGSGDPCVDYGVVKKCICIRCPTTPGIEYDGSLDPGETITLKPYVKFDVTECGDRVPDGNGALTVMFAPPYTNYSRNITVGESIDITIRDNDISIALTYYGFLDESVLGGSPSPSPAPRLAGSSTSGAGYQPSRKSFRIPINRMDIFDFLAGNFWLFIIAFFALMAYRFFSSRRLDLYEMWEEFKGKK